MTTIRPRVHEYLSMPEYRRLLNVCGTEEYYLLLRTMWETGGRIGEVLQLRPEDIDTENNCLILRNFKQKRKSKTDPKPAPPLKRIFIFQDSDLCSRLVSYCREHRIKGWVFPGRRNPDNPMNTVYAWRLITRLAKGAGIRHIKKDRATGQYMNRPAWPHLFRHGAAMNMLRRTSRLDVVRDQLGHRTVQTTEMYAGLGDPERQEIIQRS